MRNHASEEFVDLIRSSEFVHKSALSYQPSAFSSADADLWVVARSVVAQKISKVLIERSHRQHPS
jgi:hypothetical protein